MPTDHHLLYEVRGSTGIVTLNRPEARNALTFAMYTRLGDILATVDPDGPVRAIVVRGAGDKAFAAGTDISLFQSFTDGEQGVAYEDRMVAEFARIEACPVPIIAVLRGACTGGGAAIAALADIRIGSRDLRFGVPIAKTLGNCLAVSTLAKLVDIVGRGRTTDLLMTSRLLDGEAALAAGLVTELLPDGHAAEARALDLAAELATAAPLTLRATKRLLARLSAQGPTAPDRDVIRHVYGSHDFREGVAAFVAKRKPQWSGQ